MIRCPPALATRVADGLAGSRFSANEWVIHVVTKAAAGPRRNIARGQRFAAVGADEDWPGLVVARAMNQFGRRAVGELPPPVAPLHQCYEHREELTTLFSEPVLVSCTGTGDVVSNEDLLVDK